MLEDGKAFALALDGQRRDGGWNGVSFGFRFSVQAAARGGGTRFPELHGHRGLWFRARGGQTLAQIALVLS